MAPLLKPEDCCLLLIDPVQRHAIQAGVGRRSQHAVVDRHMLLQRAAHFFDVPTVHAIYGDRVDDEQWIVPPGDRSKARICSVDPKSSLWSSGGVGVALKEQGRACLVLCGYWLEGSVTFAALNALADGFDVFVLMDLSPSFDKHAENPAVHRLLQAGVVPLTTVQMVQEWAEETTSEAQRCSLLALLQTTS